MEHLGDVTDTDTLPPPAASPRSRNDRVIGGVAGLIATRLGLDALWVRLGFVVLGLAGGVGVVVYAGLWLLLVASAWTRWARVGGGVVLIGLVPALLSANGNGFVTGPIAIVLLLAGLALALWQPNRESAPPAAAFPPPTPGWAAERAFPDASEARNASPTHPLRPPREPSLLGRFTLAAAAVVGAVWAIADQADGGRNHPEQWLGAAAVICAAGLVVGAFVGRARWLVIPALLLGGAGYVTGTTARLGIPFNDTAGDRYVSIGSFTSTPSIDERVGVGEIRIDVGEAPPQPVHVDARVGFGKIEVWVHDEVTVEVRPRADHGDVRSSEGLVALDRAPIRIGDGATPDVVIDAWVGRGDITVGSYAVTPGFPDVEVPPMPATTSPGLLPAEVGSLVTIRDGVSMTADGWVVLGEGDAVISPSDEVTASAYGSNQPTQDGATTIDTQWGPFRLLPRSLLITPDQQILDLQALRQQVAAQAGTVTTTTTSPPAASRPPASISPVPSTVPADGQSPSITTLPGG